MSKSYNNCIYLSDSEEVVRQKVRNMMTDPQRKRRNDPGDPDVCPAFAYHQIFTSEHDVERIATECRSAAIGCVDCKGILAENMLRHLAPIHERRARWAADPESIDAILEAGTAAARAMADETMSHVREAMKI